ncbi:outer dense fiber of sperm tails 3-like 2, partial [Chelydra serpentina]
HEFGRLHRRKCCPIFPAPPLLYAFPFCCQCTLKIQAQVPAITWIRNSLALAGAEARPIPCWQDQRSRPRTPGPGRYSPEKAPPVTQRRPPSFTMGSRTKCRRVDPVPAPNSYALPSLLGSRVPSKPSSPSVTISGRNKHGGFAEDLSQTPGPAHYNRTDPNTYLPRPPAFSIQGRHSAPRAAFRTPGPGTHSPEKVTDHRTRAPAYSLGVRHSEFVTPLIVDVLQ